LLGNPRFAVFAHAGARGNEAVAVFKMNGVTGEIRFTQDFIGGPTMLRVTLSGLARNAKQYHVHERAIDRILSLTEACSAASVGGHWNPLQVPLGVCNSSQPSSCEAGDISGKYGDLSDKLFHNAAYNDSSLDLSGPNSIVGRSIVIHDKTGARWACANIIPADRLGCIQSCSTATSCIAYAAAIFQGTGQKGGCAEGLGLAAGNGFGLTAAPFSSCAAVQAFHDKLDTASMPLKLDCAECTTSLCLPRSADGAFAFRLHMI
jgi:Cu/Zn superoxide dismutase